MGNISKTAHNFKVTTVQKQFEKIIDELQQFYWTSDSQVTFLLSTFLNNRKLIFSSFFLASTVFFNEGVHIYKGMQSGRNEDSCQKMITYFTTKKPR